MSYQYPQVPLGDVCRFVGGGTPSRKTPEYFVGDIPWATVKDFKHFRIADTEEHISEIAVSDSATNVVEAGTVLLVSRVSLGKVAIAERKLAINQDIKGLTPAPHILSEYLFWFLLSRADEIKRMGAGATVKGITLLDIKAIQIPVPPLPEQHRIVDILSRAEGIVRLRRDAQRKTAELMPGIFLDMFGDPATNPKGWNAAPLGELCDVKGGGTPSKQNPDFWIGEIPWVSPKDMSGVDFIVDAEDHISLNAVKSSATNLIPVGSVLIVTRSGVLKHTIPCAITAREVAINQDIKAFVPRKGMAPHFLLSQIQIRAKEILGLVRVGATVQNIETESLKRMRFIYPSLENQVKFIEKCEQIRSIQSQQAAATAKAQAAFEALLAQAFVAK